MAINLQKGQKVSLEKKSSAGLGEILVNLNWNSRPAKQGFLSSLLGGNQGIDLDLGCLYELKNGQKGAVQALGNSFGNLNQAPYISLDGDNRTGAGDGDDERILIDLQAIDSNIAKIAFVVTIHNAQAKRQTFGMIDNSYVRLLDAENNEKELCRFNLKEDGSTSTSVIFAELYKAGSEWEFKAVGEGRIADLNGILALYA